MISLLHSWRRWASALLATLPKTCLSCGGAYRGTRNLPLCQSCWQSIPWIHEVQCECCGRYEACMDCKRRPVTYFTRNRSAVRYDEQMKSWLALYKYRGQERLKEVLGPMLMHALQLHRAVGKRGSTECITFVPLSRERFGERGFNQAEHMAMELGKRAKIPVLPLFERTRHTNKQSLKARAERVDDMLGIFRIASAGMRGLQRLQRQHSSIELYIVDDVYTTGSTLNECARVVKEQFPAIEVYGLNWAR